MFVNFFKTFQNSRLRKYLNNNIWGVIGLLFCLTFQTQAAPGDLDPTFGTGGRVSSGFNSDTVRNVAIQNDGKIVAVGIVSQSFGIARFNSDGSIDASFGVNGKVTTTVSRFIFHNEKIQVVIQNDGKILVAGRMQSDRGSFGYDWVIVRYNSNGSLDTTFDGDGILETVTNSPNGGNLKILPLDNGKFYVVGTCRYDFTLQTSPGTTAAICIIRFNANGSKDTSYNTNGIAVAPYAYQFTPQLINYRAAYAHSAVLQEDGKIVIVSDVYFGTHIRTAITRINPDGSPDSTFGPGSEGNLGWNYIIIREGSIPIEIPNDMVLQPDGKFVVVGRAYYNNSPIDEFTILRFNANGFLDNTFDSDGIVNTDIRDGLDDPRSVVLQPNGKIIAVGESRKMNPISIDSVLVRYNSDGSLDNSFGTNGIAIHDLSTFGDGAYAAELQSDGKLVAVGRTVGFSGFVARFLTDSTPAQNRTKFDFDGDGKADISVFRPSNGAWYLNQSQNGFTGVQFGVSTDKIVPADFDGDGKTDIAVFRPSNGAWYLQQSTNGFTGIQFGQAGDIPVPADFDGDAKADIAVFRPSNGAWYLLRSRDGFIGVQFGQNGDKPVAADYDGDGKADIAVVRQTNGASLWYILGSSQGFYGVQFGFDTDKLVPADYDGDGKTDIAVYRNGAWYLQQSRLGFAAVSFGVAEDKPVAADYDGDDKADIAVFRPSNGAWYIQRSTAGFAAVQFGVSEDTPTPNTFVR